MVLRLLYNQIKYRLLERSWDKLLKPYGGVRHGWQQYCRVNDIDFNYQANTLKEKFCGYPYIITITNFEWSADLFGAYPDTNRAVELCNQICQNKYRVEWNRNILCHDDLYLANGQSVNDVVYIGFKSQEDYTQFRLCWD